MDLQKVSRDDWMVGGVGLLLALDLLAFPWFSWGVGYGSFHVSADFSATGAPDGWLGVLALLATVALIADLGVERLSPGTRVPTIGGTRPSTRFALAGAASVLMAVKFLLNIHFSYFGWGFYLGVILLAALLALTSRARTGATSVGPTG